MAGRSSSTRSATRDVALLACYFADRFAREFGKRVDGIAPEALERLQAYTWPGNVRELSNVIERTVVLARGPILDVAGELLPGAASAAPASPSGTVAATPASPTAPQAAAPHDSVQTLEELERRHIRSTLERTGWVIEGERGAAVALGMSASTLRSRMKKLGVRRPAR